MSSAEVILTKLGLLAGDDELDILPHFHNVFPAPRAVGAHIVVTGLLKRYILPI